MKLVEASSWKQINNPEQWPPDLHWALAEFRRQSDGNKDAGVFNAASPRFIVTHGGKVTFWAWGYPSGWNDHVKPYLDRLLGPEFARG